MLGMGWLKTSHHSPLPFSYRGGGKYCYTICSNNCKYSFIFAFYFSEPMLYSELCKEVFDNASQSQVMNFLLPSLVADPNIHLSYIAESLLLYINSNFDWLSHTIAPSSLLFSLLTIVHSKHGKYFVCANVSSFFSLSFSSFFVYNFSSVHFK